MKTNSSQMKAVIFGASRGLGAAVSTGLLSRGAQVLRVARNFSDDQGEIFSCDLSKDLTDQGLFTRLLEFQPTHIFYVAGGGPFGNFSEKNWASHKWAMQVSFLSALEVFHWSLSQKKSLSGYGQAIFVGSSVAEDSGDQGAGSYAASKHALKGFYSSFSGESFDLRLFSPGYMNTDLLPEGAWPRTQGKTIWEPEVVADLFIDFARSEEYQGHLSLPRWTDDA